MKTIEELDEIRKKTFRIVNQRKDSIATRVVVGMDTCGIEAGARAVLLAIMDEIAKLELTDISVVQTGCMGACELEPIVEIVRDGEEKVTYGNMTPEKAVRVVNEHLVEGKTVDEYAIHLGDGKSLNDYTIEND